MRMGKKKDTYGNDSISLLKGADRVRLRPAVIFGSDGLKGCQHAFIEILANAIDEAREGFGKKIEVTVFKDYSIMVKDYGRGIPWIITKKKAAIIGSWFFANSMPVVNMKTIQEATMNIV